VTRAAHSRDGELLESPFQRQILDLARWTGWRVAHFRPARTAAGGMVTAVQADGAGFPDLVLVRGPELILAELKTRRGRVTREQQVWLDAFEQVELAVAALVELARDLAPDPLPLGAIPVVERVVWRPADWDLIEARLKRTWPAATPLERPPRA
jgi:hypothetical protein